MAFENKVITGAGVGAALARQLALKRVAPSTVDTMARAALGRGRKQQPH